MSKQTNAIIKQKELFENERFSPISGWSSKGLIMTDRKAFSTRDGSLSWNTTEQADEGLISFGWEWEPDGYWVIDTDFPGTDQDGWSYDVNFGTFESASPVKGMMHFVRRRRRLRNQRLVVSKFFNGTCDHCDSQELDRLSSALLKSLAEASVHQGSKVSEVKINILKSKLLETLNVHPNSERLIMPILNSHIESFASTAQRSFSMSMSAAFSSNDPNELLALHTAELTSQYFKSDERLEIAAALIRKHDLNHEYHCNVVDCGNSCVFCPIRCPNEGCPEYFSAKWAQQHDVNCPHKIVECRRTCGDIFPRKDMESHLEHSCPMRPVLCPFSSMGCITELIHRTLPDHMDTCTQSHILLLLKRVEEHQNVLVNVHQKIEVQELVLKAVGANVATLDASVIGVVKQQELSEKKVLKTIHDDLASLEKKITKSVASVQTEVTNVRASVQQVQRQHEAYVNAQTQAAKKK